MVMIKPQKAIFRHTLRWPSPLSGSRPAHNKDRGPQATIGWSARGYDILLQSHKEHRYIV